MIHFTVLSPSHHAGGHGGVRCPVRCTGCAPHGEQGHPRAAHGRRKAPIASKSVRYGDIRPSILFSPPGHGLVARRYSSEAIDMTIY